jgi:anti-sigma regulatory factor (Ser/Thr protein kinase)
MARRRIRRWFTMLRDEELRDATLLVSELVTNAVQHGRGKITLQASVNDDRLFVEVVDEGDGLERSIRERDFEKVEGWGLKTVDAAASRWGAHEGTTHVWFELERRGPRLGAKKKPER